MRAAQWRIYSRILDSVEIPNYIYAFEKNKSIPAMAVKHVKKAVIISLDIKDFFHTIKQTRLQEFYKSLGIGDAPARTLSELCTFKAFVPQGAITSPKISNIICAKTFGPLVKAYCDGKGLTLTIYADDITMSTNDPNIDCAEVISVISDIVDNSGFRINRKKTKVMRNTQRQYVCGVVVNEKTNLIKGERLRLRAIVHNVRVNGPDHEALKNQVPVDHFIDVLRGKINWYTQLRPDKAKKLSAELTEALKLHKYKEGQERKATVSVTNNAETIRIEGNSVLVNIPSTNMDKVPLTL